MPSAKRVVKMDGEYIDNFITNSDDTSISVRCNDEQYILNSDWEIGNSLWAGNLNGNQKYFKISKILNGFEIEHQAYKTTVYVYSEREAELDRLMPVKIAPDTSNLLMCPMPGMLNSVNVKAGDEVEAGQALCIVEAMKMENILVAEKNATIKIVHFDAGDNLKVDDIILEFETDK